MTVGVTLIVVPLPTDVPPQLPLYHCQAVELLSVPLAMLRAVLCVPQLVVWLADTEGVVGGVQGGVMVAQAANSELLPCISVAIAVTFLPTVHVGGVVKAHVVPLIVAVPP